MCTVQSYRKSGQICKKKKKVASHMFKEIMFDNV